jgi:hypothetical protein
MIWITAILFMLLWIIAMATSHTFGGLIHVALLATIGLIVIKAARSRKKPDWLFLSPRHGINNIETFMLYSKMSTNHSRQQAIEKYGSSLNSRQR